MFDNYTIEKWEDDHFWKKEWERINQLQIKTTYEVVYDDKLVTFKTPDWTRVLTWAKEKDWVLLFHTIAKRSKNDINEFKKLLEKINHS